MEEAERLSKGPLGKAERAEPLVAEETKALERSRELFLGLRDYAIEDPVPSFALGKISVALGYENSALDYFDQTIGNLIGKTELTRDETILLAESFASGSRIALLRNQYAVAEESAREAVKLVPVDSRYKLDLASALIQTEKKEEARKLLDAILKADPTNSRASLLLRMID